MQPDSDLVRELGLRLIGQSKKNGIRLSQLIKNVEDTLVSYGYKSIPDKLLRNSLWNIETLYPELVRKEKVGPRLAILHPTLSLIEEVQEHEAEIEANQYEIDEAQFVLGSYYNSVVPTLAAMVKVTEQESLEGNIDRLLSSYEGLPENMLRSIHNIELIMDLLKKELERAQSIRKKAFEGRPIS